MQLGAKNNTARGYRVDPHDQMHLQNQPEQFSLQSVQLLISLENIISVTFTLFRSKIPRGSFLVTQLDVHF